MERSPGLATNSLRLTLLVVTSLGWVLVTTGSQAQMRLLRKEPPLVVFANGESVSRAEFEQVYGKTFGPVQLVKKHTPAQYRDYLKLYINFTRKVMEAEQLGLDTTQGFRQEYEGYVQQLSQTYLLEREVLDGLVQEAYQRSHYELRARHLLVALAPNSSPEDTLVAYNRAILYRDSVIHGQATFAQMAQRHSNDPSVAQNQGDLGLFTVFDMVYPFETAAYSVPVGVVTMPVRTLYGYHLIQVTNRFLAQGNRRCSHIVALHTDATGVRDTATSFQRIMGIYQRLLRGEEFAQLARSQSDDPVTAPKGGDLGTDKLLPALEDVKRALPVGHYSRPFYSPFGWHILMVTEVYPVKPLDEVRPQLMARLRSDARVRLAEDRLVENLKRNYRYRVNRSALKELLDMPGRGYNHFTLNSFADVPENLLNSEVFSFADQKFTVKALLRYHLQAGAHAPTAAQALEQDVDQMTRKELFAYEESLLPMRFAEFRELTREYHDGILHFILMEQKVWRRATEDSAGLRNYYTTHQQEFRRIPQLHVVEYTSTDSAALAAYRTGAPTGFFPISPPQGAGQLVSLSPIQASEQMLRSSTASGDLLGLVGMGPGHCGPVTREQGYYRLECIKEVTYAEAEGFEDSRPEVVQYYQQYLEEQWLQALARNYPVVINEKVFKHLFKKRKH